MFWTLALLLTALVAATIAWPLVRRHPAGDAAAGSHDLEVYAAQLGELDGDVGRGIISSEDAAVARAEIGRRLLRGASLAPQQRPAGRTPFLAGLAVALALPLASLGAYASLGEPGAPDRPLAARAGEAPDADVAQMIAAAEARLAADPEDGRGWDVLAPIYLRMNEAGKATEAFRNAIARLGETPERRLGEGEALMRVAGGEITDEARGAFERAASLDPSLMAPRVFLALDLSQEGRLEEATDAWNAVLAESPDDAPWRPLAEAALREAGTGGPAPTDVAAAAAAMPEGERDDAIAGMVAGLAARLEASPDDAAGWARLIRAYGVLGDEAAASAALARAGETFSPQSPEWAEIAESAQAAGLTPEPRS